MSVVYPSSTIPPQQHRAGEVTIEQQSIQTVGPIKISSITLKSTQDATTPLSISHIGDFKQLIQPTNPRTTIKTIFPHHNPSSITTPRAPFQNAQILDWFLTQPLTQQNYILELLKMVTSEDVSNQNIESHTTNTATIQSSLAAFLSNRTIFPDNRQLSYIFIAAIHFGFNIIQIVHDSNRYLSYIEYPTSASQQPPKPITAYIRPDGSALITEPSVPITFNSININSPFSTQSPNQQATAVSHKLYHIYQSDGSIYRKESRYHTNQQFIQQLFPILKSTTERIDLKLQDEQTIKYKPLQHSPFITGLSQLSQYTPNQLKGLKQREFDFTSSEFPSSIQFPSVSYIKSPEPCIKALITFGIDKAKLNQLSVKYSALNAPQFDLPVIGPDDNKIYISSQVPTLMVTSDACIATYILEQLASKEANIPAFADELFKDFITFLKAIHETATKVLETLPHSVNSNDSIRPYKQDQKDTILRNGRLIAFLLDNCTSIAELGQNPSADATRVSNTLLACHRNPPPAQQAQQVSPKRPRNPNTVPVALTTPASRLRQADVGFYFQQPQQHAQQELLTALKYQHLHVNQNKLNATYKSHFHNIMQHNIHQLEPADDPALPENTYIPAPQNHLTNAAIKAYCEQHLYYIKHQIQSFRFPLKISETQPPTITFDAPPFIFVHFNVRLFKKGGGISNTISGHTVHAIQPPPPPAQPLQQQQQQPPPLPQQQQQQQVFESYTIFKSHAKPSSMIESHFYVPILRSRD